MPANKKLLSTSLILVFSLAAPAFGQSADPLATEANRREDVLMHEDFNLTQSWSFGARPEKMTVRLDFFVPESGEEHTFSFWAGSKDGKLGFRLLDPDGKTQAQWSGRKGEVTVALDAPAGKYGVEIDRAAGTSGRALFGAKGAVLRKCELGGEAVEEHAAAPVQGFHWPYLLFVPKQVRRARLLVVPNNTGFATEDLGILRTSASCEVKRQTELAERLGTPLLVPLFPRPKAKGADGNLYLHALTRAALAAKAAEIQRVDLQLLAMIDDARALLRAKKVEIDVKVFLWGFSASASFVSRFAILHPDRVAAIACGSPGGWPIAPVADFAGEKLSYPVGVADVTEFVGRPLDRTALTKVRWLFCLGDQDKNDAVPYRDSFSKADEELIFRRFGKTPAMRWTHAKRLYAQAGLSARFALYPGAAHSVTPEMEKDILVFFEKTPGR